MPLGDPVFGGRCAGREIVGVEEGCLAALAWGEFEVAVGFVEDYYILEGFHGGVVEFGLEVDGQVFFEIIFWRCSALLLISDIGSGLTTHEAGLSRYWTVPGVLDKHR